jgi:peptidoglycan hydrolase CwlO-like protein
MELTLLKQQVVVLQQELRDMQQEINQVLGDMSQAIDMLMRTNQKALHALQYQIDEINKRVTDSGLSSVPDVPNTSSNREGKEI